MLLSSSTVRNESWQVLVARHLPHPPLPFSHLSFLILLLSVKITGLTQNIFFISCSFFSLSFCSFFSRSCFSFSSFFSFSSRCFSFFFSSFSSSFSEFCLFSLLREMVTHVIVLYEGCLLAVCFNDAVRWGITRNSHQKLWRSGSKKQKPYLLNQFDLGFSCTYKDPQGDII